MRKEDIEREEQKFKEESAKRKGLRMDVSFEPSLEEVPRIEMGLPEEEKKEAPKITIVEKKPKKKPNQLW